VGRFTPAESAAQDISAQIASTGQEARQADHGALRQAQAQMEKWAALMAAGPNLPS